MWNVLPVGPLQKLYGHAPPILVRNGYCPTCVGCQRNCYDFNPRAAIYADLEELDYRYSEQRLFFAALLPGLILGFWLARPPSDVGVAGYLLKLAAGGLLSSGVFQVAKAVLPVSPYRLAAVFVMAALILFYAFAGPTMIVALNEVTGSALPSWTAYGLVAAAATVAALVLREGARLETAYPMERQEQAGPSIAADLTTLPELSAGSCRLRERSSGRSFTAKPGRSLLEILEAGGHKIDFGCRMGLCGADPVAVLEGAENLSPPSSEEAATLCRLGIEGRARMACACRILRGAVDIDAAPDIVRLAAHDPTLGER